MILITGATGHLGMATIDNLLKKIPANQIVALVRDPQKAAALQAKGVTIRQGDYHNTASLKAAMQGISKLLLISSSDFHERLQQHKNVIDAAAAAGVAHILYTGVSLKNIESSPLRHFLQDHFQTEQYIRDKNLTYTFFQNGLYAEVIPMFLGENVLNTGIFFPAASGKVAFVNREDLAAVNAHVLTTPGHENKTYPLTGGEAVSFDDIAKLLGEITQQNVPYISPEPQVFADALRQHQVPEHIIGMSLGFAAGMAHNDFDQVYPTVENLLGRKPTTLKTFLTAVYKK